MFGRHQSEYPIATEGKKFAVVGRYDDDAPAGGEAAQEASHLDHVPQIEPARRLVE